MLTGLVAKMQPVASLPDTAPVAVKDVEEDDFVAEDVGVFCVNLSSRADEANEMLKPVINSVCLLYDVPVQGLLQF